MRRALIFFAFAAVAWGQPIPSTVKRPCTGSVTTNCTPQVNGGGSYVPPAGGGAPTGAAGGALTGTYPNPGVVGSTSGATDPATCTPGVTLDNWNTTSSSWKYCSATNTWSAGRSVIGNLTVGTTVLASSPADTVFVGNNLGNGSHVTSGFSILGLGYGSCDAVTSGFSLVCLGNGAGQSNTTGTQNIFVNRYAGHSNTTGSQNTAIGDHSLETATATTGVNGIGGYTFNSCTSCNYSNGMGLGFGQNLTTGSSVAGVGHHGLFQMQIGTDSWAGGHAAGYSNITGSRNIFQGSYADFLSPGDGMVATISSGSANLGVGVYIYKVAYVLDGVISGLNASAGGNTATTDSTHREITLTAIPIYSGPLTASARKIYRTVVNGTTSSGYFLVTTISDNSTSTFVDTVADGSLGARDVDPVGCILIGAGTDLVNAGGGGPFCWKSGQVAIGGSDGISEVYLGVPYKSSPVDKILTVSGSLGTDQPGANINVAGGWNTGAGAPGAIIFSTGSTGSPGTSRSSWTERARITPAGLGIGLAPSYPLHVTGSSLYTVLAVNTGSGNNGILGQFTGGGTGGVGVYGLVSGNASTSASGIFGFNSAATGADAYAARGLANGNNTRDYGGAFTASGASATVNYGVQGIANGATSGTNYGGWFTATTGSANIGLHVDAGVIEFFPLKTTGAASGKTVVCVDTTTGILYASTSGVACAN